MIQEYRVDKLPMPKSLVGLLEVLRKIFAKPYIEHVIVSNGNPIEVAWYAEPHDAFDAAPVSLEVDDLLGKIQIEEIEDTTGTGRELLTSALIYLSIQGAFPVGIVTHSIQSLKNALGIPQTSRLYKVEGTETVLLAGLVVLESTLVESDAFVVLAGRVPAAPVSEAALAVRFVA